MRIAIVAAFVLLVAACSPASIEPGFCATTCTPSCGTMIGAGPAPCMGHIEPDGGSDTCFTQCISWCGSGAGVPMCTPSHAVDCGPSGVPSCVPR